VNHDVAGLGHSLHPEDGSALQRVPAEVPEDEPLLGAGAAIVLAVAFGALFWALVYTLIA